MDRTCPSVNVTESTRSLHELCPALIVQARRVSAPFRRTVRVIEAPGAEVRRRGDDQLARRARRHRQARVALRRRLAFSSQRMKNALLPWFTRFPRISEPLVPSTPSAPAGPWAPADPPDPAHPSRRRRRPRQPDPGCRPDPADPSGRPRRRRLPDRSRQAADRPRNGSSPSQPRWRCGKRTRSGCARGGGGSPAAGTKPFTRRSAKPRSRAAAAPPSSQRRARSARARRRRRARRSRARARGRGPSHGPAPSW
jgi:hypothetical protein